MAELKKEIIGAIGTPEIKQIINSLDKLDMGLKVNKPFLSDSDNFAYKLYVEYDSETKVVKNMIIEIEK